MNAACGMLCGMWLVVRQVACCAAGGLLCGMWLVVRHVAGCAACGLLYASFSKYSLQRSAEKV